MGSIQENAAYAMTWPWQVLVFKKLGFLVEAGRLYGWLQVG